MAKLKNFLILVTLLSILIFLYSNMSGDSNLKFDFTNTDAYMHLKKEEKNISKEILRRTMQFMINDVSEEDPELLKFVRSLIQNPSDKPLNLTVKDKTDFSQIGQSHFVDDLLGKKRNGFFIESGGFDGETYSNTLFFELERGWTGILIEALPSLYEKILSKNRKIYVLNACIAREKPSIEKFRVASELSGRISQMSEKHVNRIDNKDKLNEVIYVPCFSMNTILKALSIDKVDYFSLDIEGGELDVLTSLNLKKLDIKSFTIEHNGEVERRDKMINHLVKNGYLLKKTDYQDIYLIKN